MSCLRCEIARAKFIAMGLSGLRRTTQQIADDLRTRYGTAYYRDGRKVMRTTPDGVIVIHEARR